MDSILFGFGIYKLFTGKQGIAQTPANMLRKSKAAHGLGDRSRYN